MMIRTSFLLCLLPLVVQGFGVTTTRLFGVQRATLLSAAIPEDDEYIPDYAPDEEDLDVPAFFLKDDVVKDDAKVPALFKDIQAKAQEIITEERIKEFSDKAKEIVSEERMKEFSDKAQAFMEDERVKEMSSKATEFTKDFASSIFKTVGDTLKEMKKDKEEEPSN